MYMRAISPQLTSEHLTKSSIAVMCMLKTVWATVRQGKIELLESTDLPDGGRVLVTLIPDDETEFWLQASQTSLDEAWNNAEDDVYAQLL
jgi:hypothetical protein